jgi:hypothetical protein
LKIEKRKKMNYSIRRVGLLIHRHLAERTRSELVYWAIMVVVFMLIRNAPSAMAMLIVIGGAFYASRFFRDLHSPAKSISELMLPATRLEKLTVALLFCTVFYFAMMLACYVLGNLIGSFVYNHFLTEMLLTITREPVQVLMENHESISWVLFEDYSTLVGTFLFSQSAFLLGGIWFKRSQFFKTLLAYGLTFAALIFLCNLELKVMTSAETMLNFFADDSEHIEYAISFWRRILYLAHTLAIPALWLASYFRLTEKQV